MRRISLYYRAPDRHSFADIRDNARRAPTFTLTGRRTGFFRYRRYRLATRRARSHARKPGDFSVFLDRAAKRRKR
jgi:hypothetical protein